MWVLAALVHVFDSNLRFPNQETMSMHPNNSFEHLNELDSREVIRTGFTIDSEEVMRQH